jgi:hypothetical protein
MGRPPHYRKAKRCAFCVRKADSKEHAWPDWVLKRFTTNKNMIIGDIDGEQQFDPAQKAVRVRCVCVPCNTGWMKGLEDSVIPIAGPLMHDLSIALKPEDKALLARWAIKTSMVWEYVSTKRELYYTTIEREAFSSGHMPQGTKVLIGRYSGHLSMQTFGADGSTVPAQGAGGTAAFCTTMTFGRLAVQVLSLRPRPPHHITVEARPGVPWGNLLMQCWPQLPEHERQPRWPPPLAFGDGYSILELHHMWNNPTPGWR